MSFSKMSFYPPWQQFPQFFSECTVMVLLPCFMLSWHERSIRDFVLYNKNSCVVPSISLGPPPEAWEPEGSVQYLAAAVSRIPWIAPFWISDVTRMCSVRSLDWIWIWKSRMILARSFSTTFAGVCQPLGCDVTCMLFLLAS